MPADVTRADPAPLTAFDNGTKTGGAGFLLREVMEVFIIFVLGCVMLFIGWIPLAIDDLRQRIKRLEKKGQ